ncbi:uncharacterized protein LOC126844684 [Adelges cooleyi]|uniref:uncharacterized protein LOC126844684 n=1 Tax=Adelges cooleyi TaxID=133065 RepID=UPI00217F43F6|nr:uncharacterized protein LOC126844684 [Adelges cooleyi]XP_050439016.1 uncharacterized protein LOC126844684 [Adelges cooleyi]
MNYLGIIIIAFLAVHECRSCGPAGTPKNMCEKWNEVISSANIAKRLTTTPRVERLAEKCVRCIMELINKKDPQHRYYTTFGVDTMQLHAYESIQNSLSRETFERPLFYLFGEASVRVSKYFYRMHNYEKGIEIIHDAIYKFDNIAEDHLEPYKTYMWKAYLHEQRLKLVQGINKYKSSAEYVEKMRKNSFDLAFSKYEMLPSESREDPDMTFLIGKEKLKILHAHLPLDDKFSKVAIDSTIEEGIKYLEKYDSMSNAGDLIESRFILGNAYMVLDEIDKARASYVKALLTPVKNAEDRAFNYEVQRTLDRFYNKLAISKDSPASNPDVQIVFDNIDATVSRKYKNFWKELLQKGAFGTNIIYEFIINALILNAKTSIESENYEPDEDILFKTRNALNKLEHQVPKYEFSKWMVVLLGAENYLNTKRRSFLYLRMHLDHALKTIDKEVHDNQLTYLHGKYSCKIVLNSASYNSVINVVGWNIPTSKNDIKTNVDRCLRIMEKEDNKSIFINEIDKNILLASVYWYKGRHIEATKVLHKTIFTVPVLNAEDRWNNFLAQELLGFYQAENIKNKRNKDPFIPTGLISFPTSTNDGN